uniref:USP domain-containing protein n=1 Tax=Tetranychus urticae TaxID=32264 RepID=T1L4K4_TETUR
MQNIFSFFQLPYILSFPNIRGSCYLIAALTSLLHLYPFVNRLHLIHEEITKRANSGNLGATDAVDGRYLWTKLLYQIYNKYYKVSVKGRLSLENVNSRAERLAQAPLIFTPYTSNRDDLVLDDLLISNLCVKMRDFCDSDYGNPGGLVDKAYFCDSCNKKVENETYRIPVLALPIDVSFQKALANLQATIKALQLHCRAIVHGIQCNGYVRDATNTTLIRVPEVLAFNVDHRQRDRFDIPEVINLRHHGYPIYYTRTVNTNSITCYRSKKGLDYGDQYHKYEEGDIVTGYHTFLTFRTSTGLYDVNNCKIYEPHKDLRDKVTEDSLHVYRRLKYNALASSIHPTTSIIYPIRKNQRK